MKAKVIKINHEENEITLKILNEDPEIKIETIVNIERVYRKFIGDWHKFYFKMCDFVAYQDGSTKDNIHKGFKKHLPPGKKSTNELTDHERTLYLDRCNIEAIENRVNMAPFWEEYYLLKNKIGI